jgi:protein-disulfide isomerase
LFENPNWIGDAFERFADNADVPDMDRFRACNRDTSPVASIERDIEAVKRLGGWGTPTVLLNGTQLGEIPGLKDLEDLIAAAVGATQR